MTWWRPRTAPTAPTVQIEGDQHGVVVIGNNNVVTQIRPERAIGAGVRFTLQSPEVNLVNRSDELEQLRRPVSRIAPDLRAVVGMGGIGKSALARLVAHCFKDEFPDAQYELDLLGYTHGAEPMTPDTALERLISWADISTDPSDDLLTRAGAWRNWLRGKKALLVLDNARSVEQISHLLPGYGGCLVLITSRSYLDDSRITNITLSGLAERDAIELLARGRRGVSHVPVPRSDALAQICRVCGNIPAAVNAVAAVLSGYTDPAELLAEMAGAGHPLAGLPSADDAVRNAFDLSYRALSDDQKRFFGLLALHPGRDLTVDLASALTDTTRPETRRHVAELRDRHLIETTGNGRYGFHDVYLAHARERAPSDDATRSAVLHRISVHLGGEAVTAQQALIHASSAEDMRKARTWISAEHPNLVAVTLAAAGMVARYAWELAEITSQLCSWLGFRSVNTDIWRNMLSMAQNDNDEQGRARALRGLADVSRVKGRYNEAVDGYTRAQQLFHQHQNGRGEADVWWGLAEVHRAQGRLDVARDAFTKAKGLYEEEDDQRGAADALWGIGNDLLFEGRYPESRRVFGEVHTLFQEIEDRRGEAQAMRGLADVERMLEHRPEARDLYERAMAIYESIGDLRGQAGSLRGLGHLDRIEGRHDLAVSRFTKALDLAEELGDPRVQANMLRGLGDAERQRGHHDEAMEALTRSIDLNQRIGHNAGLAYALRVVADIERHRGRYLEARHAYERSLAVFRADGEHRGGCKGAADALSGFAELALAEQNPAEARQLLTDAIRIYESLGIADLAANRRTRLDRLPSES